MWGVPWWIGTITGAIVMLGLATLQRITPFGIHLWFLLFALMAVASNFLNWYGYYFTDNFIFCWILGGVFLATSNAIIDVIAFHRQINLLLILGFMCSMGGLILLRLSK